MTQICNIRREGTACREDITACFPPKLFKALCDPSRLAILASLARAGRPRPVGEIAACCPTDLSVVSRHLAVLRDAGVVDAEKHGRHVYYGVRYKALAAALRAMADALEGCCPDD